MMGVGAKRAIGLYRSCAPRQLRAGLLAGLGCHWRRSDRLPDLAVVRPRAGLQHCVGLRVLFFTLNREDFSFVIHLDRQPRTSRRREAQTGSRARSGSRSERTLDAVEHSRTLMEWWPFLIFHRGGLRIKVINNNVPVGKSAVGTELLVWLPNEYASEPGQPDWAQVCEVPFRPSVNPSARERAHARGEDAAV